MDVDVAEEFSACIVSVDGLQKHGALVLVEPFCCVVDVVVCACVRTSNDLLVSVCRLAIHSCFVSYHDGDIVVVDTVVVDWWL